MKVMYDKVTLIGLGLIASSMGHAMKKIGLANEIVGFSQTKETREISLDIGFVDSVAETIEEAVAGADLIVLSVPVGAMAEVAKKIGPKLKLGATITDVGSVKKSVIDMVKPHIPAGVHFIPGHPLAGTEQSGPKSGFPELFKNRWCILTPLENCNEEARNKLEQYWGALGANVEFMELTEAGDLAFFDNEEGKITHVGIVTEPGHIIHASGKVRVDSLDQQGIFNKELGKYTHKLRVIKRIF